jgi:hypothetical protein
MKFVRGDVIALIMQCSFKGLVLNLALFQGLVY